MTAFITVSIFRMRRVRLSKLVQQQAGTAAHFSHRLLPQAPHALGCDLHTSPTGEGRTGMQTHGPVAASLCPSLTPYLSAVLTLTS